MSFPAELSTRVHQSGIIAVLIIEDARKAVPLAQALLAGGIDSIELTLRTPTALEAVRAIRAEVPQMTVGVGTILTPGQVDDAVAAGAAFGVAPGMNPRVVRAAQDSGLPFAPGVCTPTDIEIALEHGCKLLKLFPAEPSGGLAYLKTIAAPFAHLGVKYIPLGGIGPANAAHYLAEPSVQAIGGSWLAPKEAIQSENWAFITQLATEARAIVSQLR